MASSIDICSSCGRKRKIYHETMISESVTKRYCKVCYDDRCGIINCEVCEEEILNLDYIKHLREFHPKHDYRDFVQFP